MALQSSGSIALSQIATEFGGSAPHALSEYYRNGGLVTSNNTSVPTSGAIDFADFYSAVKAIYVYLSSNDTNQNASTLFGSNFTTNIPKVLVINSGVEIGATSTSNYGLQVPSGMSGTLTIQNSGTISGAGGAGSSSGAGGNGEAALYINSNSVTVTNSGTIRGGGGGGGRGSNGSNGASCTGYNIQCYGGSGGSGGAGGNGQGYNQSQSNGSGGGGGSGPTSNHQAGSWFCGRSGSCWYSGGGGYTGGNGGTYGNAGGQGGGGGSAGGVAGNYISLGSGINYTLSNSGTLQGNAP